MIRKVLLWILVFFLSTVMGAYLAKSSVQAPSLSDWSASFYKNSFLEPKSELSSSFSGQIVEKINFKRQEENLGTLILDKKLNQAAMARIAVIEVYGDYTGSVSGITRESALKIASYDSSVVGDIFFSVKTEDEDFIGKILQDEIEKETLLHPKFTDIGIAEIPTGDSTSYYLMFGNKSKKTSAAISLTPKLTAKTAWGGLELWEAVNKRRIEFGVGQLTRKDELCTIASIRLNQLLELNKLDGHAGFQPVLDRSDLKWIGEKYSISEYLAQGYGSPQETVKGWENTLGHRSLLTGGEYVWGCIYSQNTFAVAITGY